MFDHPQLRALIAIRDTGSFELAARNLSVTASAISQRIRALEERVGAPVLRRGPPASLTDIGARLAAHGDRVARLEAELAASMGADSRLTLRIAVNADSVSTWFLPALAGHDSWRFHLQIEDQDHSAELLRSGEVAAAVTTSAEAVRGADCLPLGSLRYVATASPAFVRDHFANGLNAASASSAPALVFNEKDNLTSQWLRRAVGEEIAFTAHRVPSSNGFVDAVRLGIGWALNPEPLVAADIATGRLIALRPDVPLDTPLFWQTSRIGAAAMGALSRSVVAAARSMLRPPGAA